MKPINSVIIWLEHLKLLIWQEKKTCDNEKPHVLKADEWLTASVTFAAMQTVCFVSVSQQNHAVSALREHVGDERGLHHTIMDCTWGQHQVLRTWLAIFTESTGRGEYSCFRSMKSDVYHNCFLPLIKDLKELKVLEGYLVINVRRTEIMISSKLIIRKQKESLQKSLVSLTFDFKRASYWR